MACSLAVDLKCVAQTAGASLLQVTFMRNRPAISALFVEDNSHITFLGSATFADNGGSLAAVHVGGGSQFTFKSEATFDGNSGGFAGALQVENAAKVTFNGPLLMQNNQAAFGGAAMDISNVAEVRASGAAHFLNNRVISANPGNGGGAVAVFNGGRFEVAGHATFTGNSVLSPGTTFGGAIWLEVATLVVTESGSLCIQNNTATKGGGVYAAGGAQIILNGTFDRQTMGDNRAEDVLLQDGSTFTCASSPGVRTDGSYDITGPICACSDAQGGSSTCGCPTAQPEWDAAKCTCVSLIRVCGCHYKIWPWPGNELPVPARVPDSSCQHSHNWIGSWLQGCVEGV